MNDKLDVLFINPGNHKAIYQGFSKSESIAREKIVYLFINKFLSEYMQWLKLTENFK